jgi:DNA-binding GntR family transcriptional regulator
MKDKLTKLQRAILAYMAENRVPTRESIVSNLGISLATVRRAIAKLKDIGILTRDGNNRSGRYVINKNNITEVNNYGKR